jgi:Fe-S-cluster-containing dehydrogenase component
VTRDSSREASPLDPGCHESHVTRYALRIAQELCWGCKTCEAACKQENRAPDGVKLIRVVEDGPRLVGGKWHFEFVPRRCVHCDEPACAAACPAGAVSKRADGLVLLDAETCTGCRACVDACPYDAVAFDDGAGVARKCNLCHHRLDAGLLPACADNVCLAHCIHLEENR